MEMKRDPQTSVQKDLQIFHTEETLDITDSPGPSQVVRGLRPWIEATEGSGVGAHGGRGPGGEPFGRGAVAVSYFSR